MNAAVADMLALGLQYHQAGDLRAAEQLYRQILQADPQHADAHHLVGVLAYQSGQLDVASAWIGHALALNPGAASYHGNLGLVFEALGQAGAAEACYLEALRLQPENGAALENLSILLLRQNRLAETIAMCTRSLQIRHDYPEAHNHLANAFHRQGRIEEAVIHFQQTLRLKPDYAEAHNNLGNILSGQGRPDEALPHLREALRLRPGAAEVHNNLGMVFHQQGDSDQAIPHFREAIRIQSSFAQAHNNLGNALGHQGKHAESAESYKQALQIQPTYAEAYSNLSTALQRQGMLDEAIECCQQAIRLKPDLVEAHNNLGGAFLDQGKIDQAVTSFRQTLRLRPDMAAVQSNLLFCQNYDPNADPENIFAEHFRWGQLQVPATPGQPHANDADPERRLRIGYVSPDFRQHPLVRYFEPVLACHDKQRVQVFCYAAVGYADFVTARLRELAHGWRVIRGLTDDKVADQIRADGIDILVDLAGHTSGNRLGVFALKPAPVQVTWLGYLNTTGLSTVDYRLTDDILDPPGQPVLDTEKLFRLPRGFCCFAPPGGAPEIKSLPALRRGHITFGSLHNFFKFNNKVFDLWSQVLKALPDARLCMGRDNLAGTVRKDILRQFADRGIQETQLELRQLPALATSVGEPAAFLGIYEDIDVSLDVFPWTGGVTTCESLWMGVPMLSLVGIRPPARNSAALLARVDLQEWAVKNSEQFVAKAIQAASELDKLAELRENLRQRMLTTICDAARFTQSLEEAYRQMWRQWCNCNAANRLT